MFQTYDKCLVTGLWLVLDDGLLKFGVSNIFNFAMIAFSSKGIQQIFVCQVEAYDLQLLLSSHICIVVLTTIERM
jgi:hypothetical protein